MTRSKLTSLDRTGPRIATLIIIEWWELFTSQVAVRENRRWGNTFSVESHQIEFGGIVAHKIIDMIPWNDGFHPL